MNHYRSNKPTTIGSIIKSSLKRRHLTNKLSQYANFSNWSAIVGEKLSAVSAPVKIINHKILIIKVIDSVWGQEIIFNKQKILATINKEWQNLHLEDLRISVSNPVEFKKK
ncbi:MAG: DUF721 domain-containing protein [Deltaproteobacteria bacterium]|jgi:predicted nucleic acid-binding Zn ribbon protein|nr:DUF721 domain-containing protein [Deltaproteobacteria bacterium]